MDTSYNQVAGQSVERLAALSDGIFGVAMTFSFWNFMSPPKNSFTTKAICAVRLLSSRRNFLFI